MCATYIASVFELFQKSVGYIEAVDSKRSRAYCTCLLTYFLMSRELGGQFLTPCMQQFTHSLQNAVSMPRAHLGSAATVTTQVGKFKRASTIMMLYYRKLAL